MRILVVEDDPLIREFVVEALREEGYQVIHTSTGEEALACADGGSPTYSSQHQIARKARWLADRRILPRERELVQL